LTFAAGFICRLRPADVIPVVIRAAINTAIVVDIIVLPKSLTLRGHESGSRGLQRPLDSLDFGPVSYRTTPGMTREFENLISRLSFRRREWLPQEAPTEGRCESCEYWFPV